MSDKTTADVAVYAGFLSEKAKILQSTSGGIATALAEYMLSQGGYVAGVAYTEDLYGAEYIIVDDAAQLPRLKGSKYIDCEKNSVFSDVKKLLDKGERVLFFGLPCVVTALYQFLGQRPEGLITCELICHGPTDPKVHREYLAYLEKKFQSKVVEFSVRHKNGTWLPPYLYARFENGKEFKKPFYDTEYGFAFTILGKPGCYQCRFKGDNRQGDIMIGDFWGATKKDPYWNEYGVSSIFARTGQGNSFLKQTPGVELFPATYEKAVENNPMATQPRNPFNNRERFSKMLEEKGLMYAVKHARSPMGKLRRGFGKLFSPTAKAKVKKLLKSVKKRIMK